MLAEKKKFHPVETFSPHASSKRGVRSKEETNMEDACAFAMIIIITLGILAVPVYKAYLKYRVRQRIFEERSKIIDAMREANNFDLEKLVDLSLSEIDRDYLKENRLRDKKRNYKAGVILIATGIAFWLFLKLFLVDGLGVPQGLQYVSVIPTLVGVAFLFIHYTCPANGAETPNG